MSIEARIKELEETIASLKNTTQEAQNKKVYFSVPVEGTSYNGRKTITNILYTTDKFEPGENKYRIYSIDGSSKTVTLAEYAKLKDDKLFFDTPWEAKAQANINKVDQKIISNENLIENLKEKRGRKKSQVSMEE